MRHDVKGRLALLRLGRQIGAAAVAELGQAHVAGVAGVLQPWAVAKRRRFKGQSMVETGETIVFDPVNSKYSRFLLKQIARHPSQGMQNCDDSWQ